MVPSYPSAWSWGLLELQLQLCCVHAPSSGDLPCSAAWRCCCAARHSSSLGGLATFRGCNRCPARLIRSMLHCQSSQCAGTEACTASSLACEELLLKSVFFKCLSRSAVVVCRLHFELVGAGVAAVWLGTAGAVYLWSTVQPRWLSQPGAPAGCSCS